MRWRELCAAACGLAVSFGASAWTTGPAATGCQSIAGVPLRDFVPYGEIQAIFSSRCANCHVDSAGNPQADLDLDPEVSWFYLVGESSSLYPGVTRVVAGDPANSFLFQKVNCDMPDHGLRMPRERTPIPVADQAKIHDWILAGAPGLEDDTLFRARFESR